MPKKEQGADICKLGVKGKRPYIYIHIYVYTCVCVCICIYTQMVFALHKGTALNTVKWFLRGTITAFYTQFIHTYHDMLE